MVVLIALGVLVLIGLFVVVLYNRLVGIRNQVENAWKQIDVQLKRRHDLIPNLVEVVKDYMSFEQETLQQVIKARNSAIQASTPAEAMAAEGILSGALNRLLGGGRGLSRPQGQPERGAADGRAERHREQDRLQQTVL